MFRKIMDSQSEVKQIAREYEERWTNMASTASSGATNIIEGKKTYGPPKIPTTPSKVINEMLTSRFNKPQENPVKAAIAFYICGVYQVINMIYNTINPDKSKHSHTFWMVSCGVVSVLIMIQSYLVYNIVIASAFVLHTLLYYGAVILALIGTGLGVAGAVFFDKDGSMPPKKSAYSR